MRARRIAAAAALLLSLLLLALPAAWAQEESGLAGLLREETERLLSLCRTAEGDSRNAALHDLWEHLLDTAPFAPVCFKSLSVLTTEGMFSGLTPTETNPFFHMGQWSVQLGK